MGQRTDPAWHKFLDGVLSFLKSIWKVVADREFKGLGRWNFAGMLVVGLVILALGVIFGLLSKLSLESDDYFKIVGSYVALWLGCFYLMGKAIDHGVDLW